MIFTQMQALCWLSKILHSEFWIGSHRICNILRVSCYNSVNITNQFILSFWYNDFFLFIFGDRKLSKQPVDRGSTVLMRGFSCIKLLYVIRTQIFMTELSTHYSITNLFHYLLFGSSLPENEHQIITNITYNHQYQNLRKIMFDI